MVGIDDVARLAGVSTATVSRALSGRGHVAAATRAMLERGAEEVRVRRDRLVQVCHGKADMMDPPGAHAAIVLGRFRGGTSTSSTSPYSTASAGVMKRSRSMSSRTCSVARPECRAMISAI